MNQETKTKLLQDIRIVEVLMKPLEGTLEPLRAKHMELMAQCEALGHAWPKDFYEPNCEVCGKRLR